MKYLLHDFRMTAIKLSRSLAPCIQCSASHCLPYFVEIFVKFSQLVGRCIQWKVSNMKCPRGAIGVHFGPLLLKFTRICTPYSRTPPVLSCCHYVLWVEEPPSTTTSECAMCMNMDRTRAQHSSFRFGVSCLEKRWWTPEVRVSYYPSLPARKLCLLTLCIYKRVTSSSSPAENIYLRLCGKPCTWQVPCRSLASQFPPPWQCESRHASYN